MPGGCAGGRGGGARRGGRRSGGCLILELDHGGGRAGPGALAQRDSLPCRVLRRGLLSAGSSDRKHHSAGDTTAHEQRKNHSPHTAPELTIALGSGELRTMEPADAIGAGLSERESITPARSKSSPYLARAGLSNVERRALKWLWWRCARPLLRAGDACPACPLPTPRAPAFASARARRRARSRVRCKRSHRCDRGIAPRVEWHAPVRARRVERGLLTHDSKRRRASLGRALRFPLERCSGSSFRRTEPPKIGCLENRSWGESTQARTDPVRGCPRCLGTSRQSANDRAFFQPHAARSSVPASPSID